MCLPPLGLVVEGAADHFGEHRRFLETSYGVDGQQCITALGSGQLPVIREPSRAASSGGISKQSLSYPIQHSSGCGPRRLSFQPGASNCGRPS